MSFSELRPTVGAPTVAPLMEATSDLHSITQPGSQCVIRSEATIISAQTCACSNVVENYVGVPDLVVEDVSLDPPDATNGEPATVSVRIANRGTGMAWNPMNGGGFYTDVYVDLNRTRSLLSCQIPEYGDVDPIICSDPIPPGETRTFSREYPNGLLLNGQRLFYVWADVHEANSYGLIPESDECNNVFPVLNHYFWLEVIMRNW